MSNLLIRDYEISVWNDEWDFSTNKWIERRLAVIGKSNAEAQEFAKDAKLVQKVKGTTELTFKMYYTFVDTITGEKVNNPLVDLIKNETKIKLYYDGEWFDFIVKDIAKNSKDKTFTYTLTDLHVNELSKNGYDITLDTELMNNIGTAQKLTEQILEGTDWELDIDNSDQLPATTEEPLYEYKVSGLIPFHAYLIDDSDPSHIKIAENPIEISPEDTLYVFYSCVKNQPRRFQFIKKPKKPEKLELNDKKVIINSCVQYYSDWIDYKQLQRQSDQIVEGCQGSRYVFTHEQTYDSTLERYVYSYTYNGKKLKGYTETEYIAPNLLKNYVSNNVYKDTRGWKGHYITSASEEEYKNSKDLFAPTCMSAGEIKLKEYAENGESDVTESFIRLTFPPLSSDDESKVIPVVTNSGFYDNRKVIGNLYPGQKFVLYCTLSAQEIKDDFWFNVGLKELSYNAINSRYELGENESLNYPLSFNCNSSNVKRTQAGKSVLVCEGTVNDSWNETEHTFKNAKYQLFIRTHKGKTLTFYDFQIFPRVEDSRGQIIFPDQNIEGEQNQTSTSIITHEYYYDASATFAKPEDFKYTSIDNKTLLLPVYIPNAQQSRAVTISKSNRFNALQTIAETFQCWISPKVTHNPDGTIDKKKVTIKRYIANNNFCGIRYGVNLSDISRKCESKAIVTKLIVADNNNEFADNGFCSISRAPSNITGEKNIYDFSYYVNNGLIDTQELLEDLWGRSASEPGYYAELYQKNQQIDEATEGMQSVYLSLIQANADVLRLEASVDGSAEALEEAKDLFAKYAGFTYKDFKEEDSDYIKNILNNLLSDKAKTVLIQIYEESTAYDNYTKQLKEAKDTQTQLQTIYDGFSEKIKDITKEKEDLNQKFYTKYSRFIQEGTWVDEDYMDDERYYLDALATSYNSCMPKVTYTINVVDVGAQGGEYAGFNLNLADKTWVEDIEFFGYSDITKKIPFREEVVVTEITKQLDEPNKCTVKVQNFTNQFADLFSKITATTQQVKYEGGAWDRAAAFIKYENEKKGAFLQEALNNANMTLMNAGDQSVVWDNTGITVSDLASPSKQVKIVGGGILLRSDKDDGTKWISGLTSEGLNANVITAGQINTNEVFIMNGNDPTFKWDSKGITAYDFQLSDVGEVAYAINPYKGIRFDRFGLYGYSNINGATWDPKYVDNIDQYSHFALTWNGLKVTGNNTVAKIGKDKDNIIAITNGFDPIFTVSNRGDLTLGQAHKTQELDIENYLTERETIEIDNEEKLGYKGDKNKFSEDDLSTWVFGKTEPLQLSSDVEYQIKFIAWTDAEDEHPISWDFWVDSDTGNESKLPQQFFNINKIPTSYTWTFNNKEEYFKQACLRFMNITNESGGKLSLKNNIYITDIRIFEKKELVSGKTVISGGKVTTSNLVVETGAKIGTWDITDDGLVGQYNNENKSYWTGILLGNPADQINANKQVAFFAGASSNQWDSAPFYVSQNGYFKATKGEIANFGISDTGLVGEYTTAKGKRYVGIGLFNPTGTDRSFFSGATDTVGTGAQFYVLPDGHVNMQSADIDGGVTLKGTDGTEITINELLTDLNNTIKFGKTATTISDEQKLEFKVGTKTIFSITSNGVAINKGSISLGGTADLPDFKVDEKGVAINKGSISLGSVEVEKEDGTKTEIPAFEVDESGNVTLAGNINLSGTIQWGKDNKPATKREVIIYKQASLTPDKPVTGTDGSRPSGWQLSPPAVTWNYDVYSSQGTVEDNKYGTDWSDPVLYARYAEDGTTEIITQDPDWSTLRTLIGTNSDQGIYADATYNKLLINASYIETGTLKADFIDGDGLEVTNGTFSGTLQAATGTFGANSGNDTTDPTKTYITNSLVKTVNIRANTIGIQNNSIRMYNLENTGPVISILTTESNYNYKGLAMGWGAIQLMQDTTTAASMLPNLAAWEDIVAAAANHPHPQSDKRIKKDINSFEMQYESLFDFLEPCKYRYINGNSNRYHTGFIAQQVVEAIEKAGLTTNDFAAVVLDNPGTTEECWYLRRDEFVSLNTWQIQKLKPRVSSLEDRVAALEAENAELKQQLLSLKN